MEPTPFDGMPEPQPRWNGGVLTAAWVQGFRDVNGRDPHMTLLKRAARHCKLLAADSTTDDDQAAARQAAYDAGCDGSYVVVNFLPRQRTPRPALYPHRSNVFANMLAAGQPPTPPRPLAPSRGSLPQIEGPSPQNGAQDTIGKVIEGVFGDGRG